MFIESFVSITCYKMAVQFEKRRYDCSALPKGWKREELLRKTGLTSGRVDVFYYR